MKRWFLRGTLVLVALLAVLFGMLFFYPRPDDTTDPAIWAADGADLDECVLPVLDGSGLLASDIPKAYTPGCGWEHWPLPVLRDCTEPLAAGVEDLRGMWHGSSAGRDHVERVEQCGNRTVVTTAGIIHDFVTDGTLANGSRDVEPPRCMNTWAAIEWNAGVLEFRPFGGPFVAVTRKLEGEELVWTYPGAGETRMKRICTVPLEQRPSGASSTTS